MYFLQNTIRLILLMIFQIFILNNVHFLGYINPYVYILAILMWPARMNRALSLILAMGIGLVVDVFNNTPGIHASAAVLLAFLRPYVLNIFASIEEGSNPAPSIRSIGFWSFFKYLVTLTLIHHFTLFMWEAFSFENLQLTLLRVVLNTLVSITVILGIVSLVKE